MYPIEGVSLLPGWLSGGLASVPFFGPRSMVFSLLLKQSAHFPSTESGWCVWWG